MTGSERPAVNLFRIMMLCVIWVVAGRMDSIASEYAIEVQPGYERYSLNAYASYLVDPQSTLAMQDALDSDRWVFNAGGAVLNFGFTSATVWIKIQVQLPRNEVDAWYLVIPYPLLEQVDVYQKTATGFAAVPRGNGLGEGRSPNLQFLIQPNAQDGEILLLRIRSYTSLQVPLEAWSAGYFSERQNIETLMWGLYFGVLLALIAYNGFLFVSMRDPTYLYYVLYLGSMLGLMLCISGLGMIYLWHESSYIRTLLPITTGLTCLWATLFALSFLRGCGLHAQLLLVLKLVAVASAVLLLYAATGAGMATLSSGLLSIVTVGIVIMAGLNALATGAVIARYFVLAWTMFALGAMTYIFNIFNLVPVSDVTTHAIQVGSALESVLLSFALAHRIKEERQQKLYAMEQQSIAEQKVKLAQSLALEQAQHDSLTQRPNDALLMHRMQALIRQQGPVDAFAVLLFYCPQLKDISSSLGRRLAEEAFCSVVEDMNRLLANGELNLPIDSQSGSYVAVTEFGTMVALCQLSSGPDSLREYAQCYLSFYDRSIDIDGVLIHLDIECGIASYPKHGDRADLLLQHASAARDFGLRMLDRITIYSSEIEAFGRRRLLLIGGLSQAIRDSELELYLQPQVDSASLRLVGAEV